MIQFPLPLGADEIARLVPLAQAGDQAARDTLIARSMRLVATMARKLAVRSNRMDLIDDLIQAGAVGTAAEEYGVLRAIKGFDPSRGYAFSTYARGWIHAAQLAVLAANAPEAIQIKRGTFGRAMTVRRAARQLRQRLNREPTVDEIRETYTARGVAPPSPACVQQALRPADSSAPAVDELIDEQAPDAIDLLSELRESTALRDALGNLSAIEQRVIRERFGLGDSDERLLHELGEALSLSRERVRQIEAAALRKLRAAMGAGADCGSAQ